MSWLRSEQKGFSRYEPKHSRRKNGTDSGSVGPFKKAINYGSSVMGNAERRPALESTASLRSVFRHTEESGLHAKSNRQEREDFKEGSDMIRFDVADGNGLNMNKTRGKALR